MSQPIKVDVVAVVVVVLAGVVVLKVIDVVVVEDVVAVLEAVVVVLEVVVVVVVVDVVEHSLASQSLGVWELHNTLFQPPWDINPQGMFPLTNPSLSISAELSE